MYVNFECNLLDSFQEITDLVKWEFITLFLACVICKVQLVR